MPNPKSILNGQVGEQLVCAELLRRRHVTCIMPAGYPDIDLIVLNGAHEVRKLVQVKYTPKKKPTWVLTERAELLITTNLMYVLVCVTPNNQSYRFFCVPAVDLASLVKTENEAYVLRATKRSAKFKDNTMRRITLDGALAVEYEGKFELFGNPELPKQLL